MLESDFSFGRSEKEWEHSAISCDDLVPRSADEISRVFVNFSIPARTSVD